MNNIVLKTDKEVLSLKRRFKGNDVIERPFKCVVAALLPHYTIANVIVLVHLHRAGRS